MEPSVVFSLLIIITVSASSHPLETTTSSSSDEQNKIFFTVPSSAANNSNVPQPPIKSGSGENRLEITLNIDENDKEIVDNDMGKYLGTLQQPHCANLWKGCVGGKQIQKGISCVNPET